MMTFDDNTEPQLIAAPARFPLIRYNDVRDAGDALQLADVLVPNPEKGQRDHWQMAAYKLLVGAVLHVHYVGEQKNLHGVLELLSDLGHGPRETLVAMKHAMHLGERPHPLVEWIASDFLNMSDAEVSRVVAVAQPRVKASVDWSSV